MKTGYETPKSGGQPISGFGGFPASGFPTGFIVDSRTRAHRPLQPQYAQGAKHPFLGELAGAVRRYLVTPSVLRLSIQLDRKVRDLARCARLIANHRSFPPSQAHQQQGPFPPPALPGFVGTSDPFRRPDGPPFLRRRLGIATPRPSRASPTDADYLPRMPCSLPRWSGWVIDGCIVGALPRRAFPDPLGLPPIICWVGVHIAAFEACSSFTRITACQVACPPKVGFITRFRPARFPELTAR